jgi:arsenite-transporting ATPase
MRIIIFTGKGGSGVSTLAAATAVEAARAGKRTLAFGLGPGLGHAFGTPLTAVPRELTARLDAVEGHRRAAEDEFRDWLEQLLDWRGMDADLADDLSALPGMNHVGRLLDLQSHMASEKYDAIVVDGSPLAQFLDLPAALDAAARWLERLFAPRQSNVLEPFLRVFAGDYANAGEDVLERGRELLGRLADLRDDFADPEVTTVRIALTADASSVDAAEQAVSALSLFSYGVDALIVNKLLPDGVSDPFFQAARDEHEKTLQNIRETVAPLPVLAVDMRSPPPRGTEALASLAEAVYAGRDALGVWHKGPEHTITLAGSQYVMNVALPLARKEDIRLEQTDSGVIVHLDGHRCVLPLPREARFYENASWAYSDGVLRVTLER